MLNADGSTTDVTILADNGDGNVTVTARDGNKEGGVTDGKQIVLPKSQIQQGVRDYKRNQLRAETAQQTSIPQAEVQPTEVAEPTQEPTMPTDEHSNVAYEEMSAEDAWDRLVAESGDDVDIATMVAQSNIEDAQKALDKAKKQTPKLVGTTEEKLATAKAFKESVVKAQNDLAKWQEIVDVPKRRASLQTEQTELQTEPQGQQVADKLPASEEVGPTETTPVEEVAQIEESAPIEEQTKGNVSTMSQETDQVSEQVEEEKDIIEELRERNRVGNERDQRAGIPPRPSDYIEAIGKGDDKAMKAWEGEFNDYAQKLNADDLPDIESTIRNMQGHIDTIRSGNPKGYKDNSAYKAYSGIKKMLEKRRRELNKQTSESNGRLSAMSGVGLVEDARTRTLGDKTRKMLDAMAKRLGLQVEFVDEIVTGKDKKGRNTYANADIVGNKVRIAWDKRDQTLDFLLGHEFTHRMQDLSPEAYAEFVEATKQALGEEEWNKRINRMKSLYKRHGIAISEQGIIDEVVADYAGELVEERGVFDNFVERNKNNRSLLSAIADVLRTIKEFFTLGKQRKINNAIARLEALIESASEANKNTQKSLIEEAKLQIKQKMSDLQKAETTIKGWVENKKRGKSFEIKLPTQTQRMVKRAMGKDYDSHNITANGIAHGFNNHGERGKKLGPNSIPVRKEDAGLIPYIMTAPDRVEKGSTDVRNRESVRFYKNLSNGYIVVVEKERINSSDDMETISFWIEMSSEATNAQRNVVPDINVRNAILSTDVAKIRKDAETAIEKDVENSVKAQYSLQGAFYSNAHHAVEDIKQDKATPQQWIAMLKKNGGLKAGEDKWLGLEDWLNAQQGSVTKQDIIDYINENSIKIKEVEYSEDNQKYEDIADEIRSDWNTIYDDAEEMARKKYEYEDDEWVEWDHINDNIVDILESVYGGDILDHIEYDDEGSIFVVGNAINSTRLEYTTEGLKNKREIALTVPTIDPYNQSDDIHFGDAGNGRAVAWIRFGETEDADGNRVLVIDEIQSKRHQDGREKGYRDSNHHEQFENARKAYANAAEAHSDFLAEMKEKYGDPMAVRGTAEERKEARKAWKMQWSVEELGKYDELTDKMHDARKVYDAISDRRSGVPSAPFEKNRQELAMKRMLRYATDFGFDKLAWTTGEQQAKRYDIGTSVNHIHVINSEEERYVSVSPNNGRIIELPTEPDSDVIVSGEYKDQRLQDVFGKELAEKILSVGIGEDVRLAGESLRIGGEGMKGFYDKMLPSFMNKYGKKWGVKVGEVTMPDLEEGYQTMHSVDVTDAMREDVRKGQPLFSLQGNSMTAEEQRIVDEAKANGTYLKAPNGKASNLNERQWIQVRTKAFKDWFGDWEKAIRIEKLRRSKNVSITGKEIELTDDYKQNKRNAIEYGKSLKGEYVNKDTGRKIMLTSSKKNGGLYEILQHNYKDAEHILSVAAIPQIIEDSIYIDTIANEDIDKHPNVISYDYYVCGLNIGNEEYTVKAVISNMTDGTRYYDHKLTNIEKGKLIDIINKAPNSSVSISTQTPESNALSAVKDTRIISILQTNSSKVVDENGEPKVVYHGTWKSRGENYDLWNPKNGAPFYTFNADSHFGTEEQAENIINSKRRRMEEYDNDYSGFSWTYPVFLNIRNIKEVYDANLKWDPIIKEAKGEGHDGLSYENEHEGHGMSYIAFDPTQIKSATDNVGTFDASNPDIRYSLFGGNSGYVGYSMSKRAARAREEGRYPKTDFRKEYGVTAKSFDELVDAKIIRSGEWHHTSKFGNETKFYGWDEDYYADIYKENKAVIDKLSRERKTDEIVSLFENHPLAHKAEYDNETERLVDDVNREYNDQIREVENEKRDKERAYNSAVFDALGQLTNIVKANNGNLWFNASNGVGIQIDRAGNEVSMNYGGANGSKGALRYEARNELQTAIESVAKESNIESADATYYTDKVNQLEAERAERVAQLVETREKEYTPKARYSLASDMARDAVMTALEGAGIDVEMATPEMVEDVLRARDAEFMSKRSEEREQTNRWIDEATAFVSGKSIKEVRQERIRKERERKELAKEIYENVLSGNFNDVTLQKINQYIDETTPRNPYGRRLSQRLPQRVEREMYEKQRENAVDALYSRISESSVPANGRFSESGRREIESRKKEALKGWAIATGNWHTDLSAFTNQTEPIGVGTDSKVYISKDGQHVIKASKGKPYGKRFRPDIDNIPLFNSVFRNSAYEIVGYGEIDGEFVRILKQPIVDFANSIPLTEDERVEYMRSLGFEPLNKENTAFSNGEIVISDLQKSNIVKDKFGEIRVVDADAKLHTKDVGGNYEYLPVEYDLPSAELLQTSDGTVYGWTIGGKIFLTEQGMNAETPIHEYTHLWANAMRKNNEQGWGSVKDLLRGTPMWDEVLADKNYSNIHDNEDLVASEVLSRYSGKENAKQLEDEAQRMISEARGIGAKADAVSLIDRVRRALQKFWDWVGKDLFGIKDFDSIEQVTDRVLYDLMNQTDLNAEVSEGEGQQMRYSLRTKPEPKKTIKVYKLFNVDENGNPQALFIDAANSLEVGVWYDADSPTIKDLEGLETEWSYLLNNEGNVVDKKPLKRGKGGNFVGLPSKADVNKATQEGQRWMTVSTSKSGEKAYHTVGINGACGVSIYALRPGWHATNVPSARHIGVGKDGANAKYRGANQRWFEIEISADVDYNEEARERYLKAHPTYSREKAYSDLKGDIPERIPEDGYYNFKTNSNANPNQDWYIAGAIKIVRPLTEEEGRKISRSKGIAEDLPYKDGVKNFDDSEVRYSLSSSNKSVNKYDKTHGTNVKGFFDYLKNGKKAEPGKPSSFYIADAGELLEKYGIKGKFMVGDFTFSRTHTDNEDHNLGINEWVKVINNLNNPLAITRYKGLDNSYRIYTKAMINGKNICVGVDVATTNGEIKLSRVVSAYGRDIANVLKGEKVNLVYPEDIKELEQTIQQGSTAHNSLLNADSSALADKDNANSSDVQAKSEKGAKFSLQGGRSIADKYEKRVNTKGKGGAMHLSKFNFMEAWQDEMRALKEVQRTIAQEYGIVLESYEDAYMAENALSSVNQASWDRYINEVYEPMMRIHDEWIRSGESNESINHYLIAKSGLERNREFTVRDALAEMNKMDAQIINGAYSGTVLQLANALRQGQISQDEYNAQVQEAKDKKNQALENIKNAQQARVDAYRAERDALREQFKNGDITYEEFNQLSDEVAIRHAKVEEIKDYSGLTALAKAHGRNDWQLFAQGMVTAFENKHDNTDVLWERINNATKKAVEKSYESGITSKQAKTTSTKCSCGMCRWVVWRMIQQKTSTHILIAMLIVRSRRP